MHFSLRSRFVISILHVVGDKLEGAGAGSVVDMPLMITRIPEYPPFRPPLARRNSMR